MGDEGPAAAAVAGPDQKGCHPSHGDGSSGREGQPRMTLCRCPGRAYRPCPQPGELTGRATSAS